MKFGIMGPGNIARRFADAAGKVAGVTLSGVASRDLEKAKAFATEFGIENAYGSYDELLASDVDAVYISTINTTHFDLAKKSILAGKAVMVEKPMCMSKAETAELFDLAKEKNVLLMEGLWTLFLPCIKKAKQWIDEGRIGTVKYMDSAFSFYCPVIPDHRLFDKEKGGGGILDVGIYTFCFSIFMMGQNPKEFYGRFHKGETGVDEIGSAILSFDNGVNATCVCGIQGNVDGTAHIYGEKGKIELPEFWRCVKATCFDLLGDVKDTETDSQENGFVYEIAAFAKAFNEGRKTVESATPEMSIECARIMEELRAQ